MKVKELIEKLQQYDGELEVMQWNAGIDRYFEVEEVGLTIANYKDKPYDEINKTDSIERQWRDAEMYFEGDNSFREILLLKAY